MTKSLKARMAAGERLVGTFVKTPAHELIEVLALSKLDFICLDAEHAAFDRGRLDICLAMARAKGLPALVRVPAGRPEIILNALDCGATGIVVPHVDSVKKAEDIAKSAHFGLGGRGFAGSTRWAGFASRSMPEVLAQSREETIVIVQIEEPAGVEAAEGIAAVAGVDGLFIGPADLSVGYGKTSTDSEELTAAFETVGKACGTHKKTFVTWGANAGALSKWHPFGVSMFVVASEHAWMLAGANAVADDLAQFPESAWA